MVGTSRFVPLIVAVLLATYCCGLGVSAAPAGDTRNDATEIYGAFLGQWAGKDPSLINVSNTVDLPPSEAIEQYEQCAGKNGAKDGRQTTYSDAKDLISIRNPSHVHFVDPKTWHFQDPGTLISKGQSVESAVDAGMAQGLMTLSAITFNGRRDTAWFTYSFVCGRLCGNGGIVIFKKTSKRWTRDNRRCSSWMS